MSSESPGAETKKMKNSNFNNQNHTLPLTTSQTDGDNSKCLLPPFSVQQKTTSKTRASSVPLLPLLLLLILLQVPCSRSEGFCSPLLCSCQVTTANCSSRGFLLLPGGLGAALTTLNLAQNDLTSVNSSELGMYPLLEQLDLSRNQLRSLEAAASPTLTRLDLSHNRVASLRRVQLKSFPNLKTLDLSNNLLASVPPKTFPKQSLLLTLNLASNSIEVKMTMPELQTL